VNSAVVILSQQVMIMFLLMAVGYLLFSYRED